MYIWALIDDGWDSHNIHLYHKSCRPVEGLKKYSVYKLVTLNGAKVWKLKLLGDISPSVEHIPFYISRKCHLRSGNCLVDFHPSDLSKPRLPYLE